MNKYVCFHGHFYQPPRDDPWLEVVEFQENAAPYHDWNERISSECYEPNRAARRVDGENRILQIINNYEFINFNFGPTLLSWLQKYKADTYEKIIEADQKSEKRLGFGNAIAQVYNHVIMPLASREDKFTQISWGIEAFKYHFGRMPLGMWLAETAVDNETLTILATLGIKFTILSPKQAEKVRSFDGDWQPVDDNQPLDSSLPYRCFPEPGLSIDIFFYHEAISRGVSFGSLLNRGESLAQAIESAFRPDASLQIISIATDGETYGHHHKFGEMGLAYNIYYFEQHPQIALTNYSQFLSLCQPRSEVAIKERTAWSCSHGVGRWHRDCGCHTGLHPGWQQSWRKPLREGLEFLRRSIDPFFEKSAGQFLKDPFLARNDYIRILFDRSHEIKEKFLAKHQRRKLIKEERSLVFKLLEMQYHGQIIFTSCGWYFDDISGIEARQNLYYASRLIQLAKELGIDLKEEFLQILKEAKSNIAKYGNGARIYENLVLPRLYDLKRLSAHFAFDCIVKKEEFTSRSFYTAFINVENHELHECPACSLIFASLGATHLRSEESEQNLLAILDPGSLDIAGGVLPDKSLKKQLLEALNNLSFFEMKKTLLSLPHHYGIKDLFLDNQREMAQKLAEKKLTNLKNNYRLFYEDNKELILNLYALRVSVPDDLLGIIKVSLQEKAYEEIEKTLKGEKNIWKDIKKVTKRCKINLSTKAIQHKLQEFIEKGLRDLKISFSSSLCRSINRALTIYYSIFMTYDLWEAQNLLWEILSLAKKEDKMPPSGIIQLGKTLGFRMDQ